MARHVLRDKQGRKIGEIETQSNGVQVARDEQGRKKGEYDPKTDVTRDPQGRKVGQGNFLSSLITG
jgi:YD repeat-containing protein